MVTLRLPQTTYKHLLEHLNPHKDNVEQAAFLFCQVKLAETDIIFEVDDIYLASEEDFEIQSAYHIELKDDIKGKIIRQAHNLGASIIEVHSHVDQRSAKFSFSDWSGFTEFVPHVMWRLKGKPYMALVYAPDSFDALVWVHDSSVPIRLDQVVVDGHIHTPTGNSIIDFNNKRHESFW